MSKNQEVLNVKSQFLTPGKKVPNLEQAYLGTSPRSQINGTSYVFTAADFSPHRTVPRFRKAAVGYPGVLLENLDRRK